MDFCVCSAKQTLHDRIPLMRAIEKLGQDSDRYTTRAFEIMIDHFSLLCSGGNIEEMARKGMRDVRITQLQKSD